MKPPGPSHVYYVATISHIIVHFQTFVRKIFNILHMLIKINHLQNKTFTDLQLYVKINSGLI